MDIKRNLLAGILIALVVVSIPYYLELIGYETDQQENVVEEESENSKITIKQQDALPKFLEQNTLAPSENNVDFTFFVETDFFKSEISPRAGGSFVNLELVEENGNGFKYHGGYSNDGVYMDSIPVSLILENSDFCSPCLSFKDELGQVNLFNTVFTSLNKNIESGSVFSVSNNENLTFSFESTFDGIIIQKNMTFYGNSYQVGYEYLIKNNQNDNGSFELVWNSGLKPTEMLESEDVTYSTASAGQLDEIVDVSLGTDEKLEIEKFSGDTNWSAIRTKYFIVSMLSKQPGIYGILGGENVEFGNRINTPKHEMGIGYYSTVSNISGSLYIGPLDIDHIAATGTSLDKTMNLGFALIRPISKAVLWFLKFLHNTFNLNYGIVLILFALIVRVVTGPLTKKSFQSSQKMQAVQPKIKKMQAKYKDNPQKLNKEMMGFYKKEGVNPLGGCLPMLLQMPLLWALFVVFRSTIEFRGASFVFWIKDLSQPDAIFSLPFSIPIYGAHVAILPIIMGLSMFMTQKLSMATMDKSQRPMMYFMSAFFFLLFNSFPSGLNLYYTVYNILSYFQQRSIRQSLSVK